MKKEHKVFCFMLGMILLMSSIAWAGSIKNPDAFIKATTNNLETLDAHFMISTASMELPLNVYDSLLTTDPNDKGKVLPSLAVEVPTRENGLIKVEPDDTTYITFPIRAGVKFHNGALLTAEDVEYTFKRAILVGGIQETIAMFAKSLLGKGTFKSLVEEVGYEQAFKMLDQAIVVKDNQVVFKLPKPFVPFLGLMADDGKGFGIYNKEWCIENGGWPGTKESGQDYMSLTLEDDPLNDKMMGTGPYQLVSWNPGERVVLDRFDDYWRGPAKVKRVIRKIVPDQNTGILLLKKGDIDFIDVASITDLIQIEGYAGIKVVKYIPTSWLMKINFNFAIQDKGNHYIGNGQLGPEGIPGDFFSDINVRKAFQYSFDWDTFIDDVFLGSAFKPFGPVLVGYPTANPDQAKYYFDLEKAEQYFKLAWDGELWEKGFKFIVPYSSGSTHRQRALELLKDNIQKVNPKFKMEITSLPWASYLGEINSRKLPLTLLGLLPTVMDPYYTLFNHMYSTGGYATDGGYSELAKQKYDHLIEELGTNYDVARRKEISHQLQRLSYEDSLAIFHFQAVGQVAMRDWIGGYVPGPFPFLVDYYNISKKP